MATTITTVSGDTWDILALRVYGDNLRVRELMRANYPILDYEVFPAGIMVNVPELSDSVEIALPAWRT